MHKLLFTGLIAVCTFFMSCKGNPGNQDSSAESEAAVSENAAVTAAENEDKSDVYTVEDGRIVPVNGLPTIVDFAATWCGPCRLLKPIFEELKEEFKGRINFVTIDVDDNPDIAQAYGVTSIPMLVFLNRDGRIQNTLVGFQNKDQLLAEINTYFGF